MKLAQDFDSVVLQNSSDVANFVNSNVVLTGGSGFVGKWIIGSWLAGCNRLGGRGHLLITSRNPTSVLQDFPELQHSSRVHIVASDIRELEIDKTFSPRIFIHAATAASEKLNLEDPFEMIDVIIRGTEHAVKLAKRTGAQKFVNLSSGAVYGYAPIGSEAFKEDEPSGPDLTNPRNAYHEAKRLAELMVNISASNRDLSAVSLRLFAFVAPFLPVRSHFAATSFLYQAMHNRDIVITSGGGSVRSYLYGTDMASYIIRAATRDLRCAHYNVGGSFPVTIVNLARTIQRVVNSKSDIRILGKDTPLNSSSYIPDMTRTADEFGLQTNTTLELAIAKTADWYSSHTIASDS
jgi:nucleoside-diphosphate-sugar epimerase